MAGFPKAYMLRPDGVIEECPDVLEHAAWFEKIENRRIARTAVPYGDFKKAVIISTVFIGFEHGFRDDAPLLFETLAELPDDGPTFSPRYTTKEEALKGHIEVVKQVERWLEEWEKDEIDALIERASQPPTPKRAKVKQAQRKPADPNCSKCGGTGECPQFVLGLGDQPCDCTFLPKTQS